MIVFAEERVSMLQEVASNRIRGTRQPTNKQSPLSRLPVAGGGMDWRDYHREVRVSASHGAAPTRG